MITGNIDGVRKRVLEELEEIFELKTAKYQFLDVAIIEIMVRVTKEIKSSECPD